jgi:hypothetical protein
MNALKLLRLVGIILGLGLAVAGLIGLKSDLRSAGWRHVAARIVVSEPLGRGERRSSLVMAEYRVGEAIYQCGHVREGRGNTGSDAKRYPVGAAATVSYDPVEATRCALESGVTLETIALLVAGAAFMGLAIFANLRLSAKRPKS